MPDRERPMWIAEHGRPRDVFALVGLGAFCLLAGWIWSHRDGSSDAAASTAVATVLGTASTLLAYYLGNHSAEGANETARRSLSKAAAALGHTSALQEDLAAAMQEIEALRSALDETRGRL